MPKLCSLSGKEIIVFCEQYGFRIGRQRGSHVNIVRETSDGKQVATIPNHKEIDKGTLRSIFKQLLRFLPEDQLRKLFYTD